MDVQGYSTRPGAVVYTWGWHGNTNQRWYLTAVGTKTSKVIPPPTTPIKFEAKCHSVHFKVKE